MHRGAVILRYFRQTLAVDDKDHIAGFSPVTAADREAEATIRALIEGVVSRPRHPRRGVRARAARCPFHLGHRPHRRHQGLHLGHDDLGYADRAAGWRPGHHRCSEPAFPRRAIRRPRRGHFSRRAPSSDPTLRRFGSGGALRHRARHVRAGRACRLRLPRRAGSSAQVRRRLLRLRDACRGLHRSGCRGQHEPVGTTQRWFPS